MMTFRGVFQGVSWTTNNIAKARHTLVPADLRPAGSLRTTCYRLTTPLDTPMSPVPASTTRFGPLCLGEDLRLQVGRQLRVHGQHGERRRLLQLAQSLHHELARDLDVLLPGHEAQDVAFVHAQVH
jgi:hypothetical protein